MPIKRTKITDEQIEAIRREYQEKKTPYAKMANSYGISETYIGNIVRNNYEGAKERSKKYYNTHKVLSLGANLTNEHIRDIRYLYQNSLLSQKKLAQKYGVSQSRISMILAGRIKNIASLLCDDQITGPEIKKLYPQYYDRVIHFLQNGVHAKIDGKNIYSKKSVFDVISLYQAREEGIILRPIAAASVIGVTRETIRHYVKDGKFTLVYLGRDHYLYRIEVVSFAEKRKTSPGRRVHDIFPEKISNPLPSFPSPEKDD